MKELIRWKESWLTLCFFFFFLCNGGLQKVREAKHLKVELADDEISVVVNEKI